MSLSLPRDLNFRGWGLVRPEEAEVNHLGGLHNLMQIKNLAWESMTKIKD